MTDLSPQHDTSQHQGCYSSATRKVFESRAPSLCSTDSLVSAVTLDKSAACLLAGAVAPVHSGTHQKRVSACASPSPCALGTEANVQHHNVLQHTSASNSKPNLGTSVPMHLAESIAAAVGPQPVPQLPPKQLQHPAGQQQEPRAQPAAALQPPEPQGGMPSRRHRTVHRYCCRHPCQVPSQPFGVKQKPGSGSLGFQAHTGGVVSVQSLFVGCYMHAMIAAVRAVASCAQVFKDSAHSTVSKGTGKETELEAHGLSCTCECPTIGLPILSSQH